MKNILTVDLEDWFSVETFQKIIAPKDWLTQKPTVESATDKILNLFQKRNVRATFFVLGWIADQYPDMVARVAGAGHEIACHSYYHRMVCSLSPEEFKADTNMAVNAIFKACGVHPNGYRSPSWGIRRDMTWAFEILAEFGFKYDSSIFPIQHDIYGDPTAPRRVHEITVSSGKRIIEIPASTVMVFGRRLPLGGGGWLRQFPYWYTRWGIRRLSRENMPVIVYFHPWELDPDIPRVDLKMRDRFRQYGSLKTMEYKVENLLSDFDFFTVSEYIDSLS
ncbi:MAG: DUF3473 domain-containing protein [FCB group bacterium]|nr:DUF3473 domain-containing protein [FCB group bacterium]